MIRTDLHTDSFMASITIRDLKQATASVLRRVRLGEWFTVLEHGKAVARLGPAAEPGVHVGSRFDRDDRLEPLGRRASRATYLDVLAADRSSEET